MRKLSTKWVPKCLNADQKRQRWQSSEQYLEFFGAIQMISCRARLVSIDETWLYHYDPETKQQSMEWRHIDSPRPKKFRVQKSAGTVLASIFWDQDGILLIYYLPNGQTINAEYFSSLLVQVKDILKDKRRVSPKGSCSCTTMPLLTGHLQPRRNWPIWAPNVLITHTILRIWPRRTITRSLDWKNNWKVAISRPTRRPGWTDNFLKIFLSGLQKLEQRSKKCIEVRAECVE